MSPIHGGVKYEFPHKTKSSIGLLSSDLHCHRGFAHGIARRMCGKGTKYSRHPLNRIYKHSKSANLHWLVELLEGVEVHVGRLGVRVQVKG